MLKIRVLFFSKNPLFTNIPLVGNQNASLYAVMCCVVDRIYEHLRYIFYMNIDVINIYQHEL